MPTARPDRVTKPAEMTRIALEELAKHDDFEARDMGRGDVYANYKNGVALSGNIRGGFCVTLRGEIQAEHLELADAIVTARKVHDAEEARVKAASEKAKAEAKARFDALPKAEQDKILKRRAEAAKATAEAKAAEAKEAAEAAKKAEEATKARPAATTSTRSNSSKK